MKSFQLSHMEIADLCQQLALLQKSGVRIADSLFLLAEEETNETIKTILSDAAKQVDEGFRLSESLREASCFPVHMIGLLEVGEQVGRLEETLFALAHYYEEQDRTQRRLRSALTYPALLLLLMTIVIIVLLSKVLPVFEDVYVSLGASLTGMAGGLVSFGRLLNDILPFLGILLALLLLCILSVLLIPALRKKAFAFWQVRFGDKGVFRKLNDARFAQALSMAFASGLPFEECISLSASLLADCPAAVKRSEACIALLQSSGDLANALLESAMLPPSACRMLTLGMKAGTGDSTMEEIARRLSEDAREALEARVAKIEPALVLITSLLVGAILLLVMLPLMHIMKAIG